jgi:cell wall-associated NlpC family hydrolase
MNKFMGGLTLGIILTASIFIYFKPFQKNIIISAPSIVDTTAAILPTTLIPISQDTAIPAALIVASINTGKVKRDSLVAFAKSLLGTPYLYGSADPIKGFDCSGFITYVFNHFNVTVPRSSYDFANLGIKKTLTTCKPGDLLLFTGTDPNERTIGHIGIVCETANGKPLFIHSTSGKAYGVTITSMDNQYYKDRLMAVIDIL